MTQPPAIIEVRDDAEIAALIGLLEQHYVAAAERDATFQLGRGWQERYRAAVAAAAKAAVQAGDSRHRFTLARAAGSGASLGLCCSWWREEPLLQRRTGTISELFVAPSARRRGVGHALAQDALAWFAAARVSRAEIQTPLIGGAAAFWQRVGFGEDAVLMSRAV